MCNIAGYVGERRAAPILIEMLRREQGFNAGFYTGIATLSEGRIHYRKVRGDLDELERRYDIESLPGNIGFIHSRTPDMGDDEWSHPFIYGDKAAPRAALVLNGAIGAFSDRKAEYSALAERLAGGGYNFLTRALPDSEKLGLTFSDGTHVHFSELFGAVAGGELDAGKNGGAAITAALSRLPSEVVCLMLDAEVEEISFGRINMPMNVGFSSHGVYLSSTATAFLDKVEKRMLLPENSFGSISAGGVTISPIKDPPAKVKPIDAALCHKAYIAISECASDTPKSFEELCRAVKIDRAEGELLQKSTVIYEVLTSLMAEGRLEIVEKKIPGMLPQLTAPKSFFLVK
jgi:glucosamine 6-phosphate synthetase-like amidotransferase/phosphosugar isomerase protein